MSGRLELQKVSFAYPQRLEAPVFTNLSLSVEPGTTVALVGPSGSGKSSIVSLIQRFYSPTGGQVPPWQHLSLFHCMSEKLVVRCACACALGTYNAYAPSWLLWEVANGISQPGCATPLEIQNQSMRRSCLTASTFSS